ncbi:MAG: single-stranded nucleic acid binding domain protein [Peptococcaceae bacterium]|jgi:spoIIIJ-associated protein|nr:single-stranded nucleic acid binding domain protein [Peptococcaceae bacterium]
MRILEKTGRTVEEAVSQALAELKLKKDEVEIEILEEPNKGIFGLFGSKNARVRVTEKPDPIKAVKKFYEEVTAQMGVKSEIFVSEEEDFIKMTLIGNNLGILIGRRGETLDALQYLGNLVANKHNLAERKKIILDAEGYRKRREDTLVNLAARLAERVKRTGYRVVLEPMNPQERRIIHTALQNDKRVQTYSEGEEPFRKVVIALRK